MHNINIGIYEVVIKLDNVNNKYSYIKNIVKDTNKQERIKKWALLMP